MDINRTALAQKIPQCSPKSLSSSAKMPRYVTRGRRTRQVRRRTKRAPIKKYRRPTRPTRARRSGGMTSKRILNLTARKKRDTMLQWRQVNGVDGAGTASIGASAANGGRTTIFAWCPTQRDLTKSSDQTKGSISDDATSALQQRHRKSERAQDYLHNQSTESLFGV